MLTTTWARKLRLFSLTVLLSTLAATTLRAGSPIFVGRKASQQVSMDKVDHAPWNSLLKKYVNENGMVNYQALKSNPDNTRVLNRYLDSLSAASPRVAASREAKLAFWINAVIGNRTDKRLFLPTCDIISSV